jgi:hypothetical protein
MRIRVTGSGMENILIRDPGWKKFGFGIRYKHPGSATLIYTITVLYGTDTADISC